jgi:hypothetical protein
VWCCNIGTHLPRYTIAQENTWTFTAWKTKNYFYFRNLCFVRYNTNIFWTDYDLNNPESLFSFWVWKTEARQIPKATDPVSETLCF